MFKRIAVVMGGVLLAAAVSGCAIDRSQLATPEAFRELPPPPEMAATNHCADVAEDAGTGDVASTEMTFDAAEFVIEPDAKDYFACMVTSRGLIEITLFDDNAPDTVNNFVFLAQEGFYDGVMFHRVVPNFVIQGGDRNGLIAGAPGTGGPGYNWNDEAGGLALPHDDGGVLSMANAGPNTNGSQFFITHSPQPHLNGKHAVFGKVSGEGNMDVVNAVEQGDIIRTVEIIAVDES